MSNFGKRCKDMISGESYELGLNAEAQIQIFKGIQYILYKGNNHALIHMYESKCIVTVPKALLG